MKNIFLIILSIFGIFLNAQTVTLETMSQYSPGNYPNADYVKDSNGLLNKYVGNWKGTLNGNMYDINIIKKENVISEYSSTKWDRLIVRVKITAADGTIIFNNFSNSDDNANWGHNFQKDLKLYLITFSGEKLGCVDYGFIYAGIKPATPNQMTMSFIPDNDIVTQDCNSFQTTIPSNVIIHLTKQ